MLADHIIRKGICEQTGQAKGQYFEGFYSPNFEFGHVPDRACELLIASCCGSRDELRPLLGRILQYGVDLITQVIGVAVFMIEHRHIDLDSTSRKSSQCVNRSLLKEDFAAFYIVVDLSPHGTDELINPAEVRINTDQ